jgi:hypothetical protein
MATEWQWWDPRWLSDDTPLVGDEYEAALAAYFEAPADRRIDIPCHDKRRRAASIHFERLRVAAAWGSLPPHSRCQGCGDIDSPVDWYDDGAARKRLQLLCGPCVQLHEEVWDD